MKPGQFTSPAQERWAHLKGRMNAGERIELDDFKFVKAFERARKTRRRERQYWNKSRDTVLGGHNTAT